jgi:hypothetical protein
MVISCGCLRRDGWIMRNVADTLGRPLLTRIVDGAQGSSSEAVDLVSRMIRSPRCLSPAWLLA